jgi:hypothetical protein
VPLPQRTELLRLAADKAKALLQGLQRDQARVAGLKTGRRAFEATVDAAQGTVDNLNRALQGSASSVNSD